MLLNPKENARRRIFTLAHEIGHIVLGHRDGGDRMVDTRSDLVFPLKRTKEYEANEFAGELLMPEEEFRKEWNEKKRVKHNREDKPHDEKVWNFFFRN
ncbi:MAG: ImmA/IrrE family metallo-endopeptidase, partial [Alphaproteobacteria bacterium]|nr:ImmA/IrrE family metallo-endopeptidase [Alphaproteobacteria bacterium]